MINSEKLDRLAAGYTGSQPDLLKEIDVNVNMKP